jgi:maleate isomerase
MAASPFVDAQPEPEYGPVFGVLTPQANTTVEPEMQLLLAGTVLTSRSTSASPDSRQRLLDYFGTIDGALAQFDIAPVRAAGFACTGSGYLVGQGAEEPRLAELSDARGYPVISATQAIRRALDCLGARRIALLSPYPGWLSAAAQTYWRAAGYTLTSVTGLPADLLDTRGIYRLNTQRVEQVLEGLDRSGCDAVLLSGTGMPTLRAIAALPSVPPALSSNLCLAWALQAHVNPALGNRQGLLDFLGTGSAWRQRLATRQERP